MAIPKPAFMQVEDNAAARGHARGQRLNPQPIQGPRQQGNLGLPGLIAALANPQQAGQQQGGVSYGPGGMWSGYTPPQPSTGAAMAGHQAGASMYQTDAAERMQESRNESDVLRTILQGYPSMFGSATQAQGARDVANIGAQSQAERNPWDALRTMMGAYPGVYGAATQGTVAQNITQMNNETEMNKLRQILPFLQAMQGGVSTDYGAGY